LKIGCAIWKLSKAVSVGGPESAGPTPRAVRASWVPHAQRRLSLCPWALGGRARRWQRRFDDPIPLPRGRQLVTLQDAGNYITNLPKAEHDTEEWQAAMQALLLVAEHDGPTMLARIGVMRALNRHVEPVFNPARKDHHWGRRKLARDR
jgi:hypothetical protein